MDENLNEITDKIIKMSGLDIFKNTRVREYVELRSFACYIFRNNMHITLADIAKFFRSKGKSMDHATVIHAVKKYPIYIKNNNRLQAIASCFKLREKEDINFNDVDVIYHLQKQYKKVTNLNYQLKIKLQDLSKKKEKFTTDEERILTLVEGLPKTQIKEVLDSIDSLKKSWVWKSKIIEDRCEIIESSSGLSDRAY